MFDSSWRDVTLKECSEILTGHPFKSKLFTENKRDIRLLRGINVSQGDIVWDDEKRWNIKDKKNFCEYLLEEKDVVLAMDRPWVSAGLKWAWIDKSDLPCLLVQRVARIRGKNLALTDYLRLIVSSQVFSEYLKNIVTGVNVPHISKSQIQSFKFKLPPISIQEKISSFLRAFDELINVNLKYISVLDEISNSIYKEWFIHLRYLGHENTEATQTPYGYIPKGWKVTTIGSEFTTVLGGTPSRNKPEYWSDGNIPWINSGKVNELRIITPSEHISRLGLDRSAAKLMPKKTTVIAITGATLGQVSLLEIESSANQSVVGVYDPNSLYSEWIYFELKNKINEIIQKASGGAQQHINKAIVEETKIVLPDIETMKVFQKKVKPLFDLVATLLNKNEVLKQMRDLLLPKLISGEIDVSELEIRL